MLQLANPGARAVSAPSTAPPRLRPQAPSTAPWVGVREFAAAAAVAAVTAARREPRREPHGRVSAQAASSGTLQELDRLLRRLVEAEVAEESTRSRVKAEDEVMGLLNTSLRGELRGFGAGEKKVAKRLYSLQELKDNGVDATQFLNPKDSTLDTIRTALTGVAAIGGAIFILLFKPGTGAVVFVALLSILALFLDQAINKGFGELLVVDSLGRFFSSEYPQRVARHEAGHFLVAYLLGIMPKAYTLSAWEAFSKYNTMSTQAGTIFLDEAIQREVQSGKISGKTLDDFVCVALGGIAAEYVSYGQANGGMSDLLQLEALFGALKFDQQQTNVLLRTNVMNTVSILESQRKAHDALVEAMCRGESVGHCVEIIEQSLA